MKTTILCSMIVLGATPLATSADEASSTFSWGDVTFQPRVYAGYADYQLESGIFTIEKPNGTQTRPIFFDFNQDSKLQFSGFLWGIGGTLSTGQFFGDFYYQSTLNDTASSATELPNGYIGDVNAQHSDWALSLGYSITDQWSIFAGYKAGNTEWDQQESLNNGLRKLNYQFDQDGPFIGTSYSFPIGPGVLTFKVAYAYMNGTYERSLDSLTSSDKVNLDGDSNAYSLGLSWTQSLTDNLGVSMGANYHKYEFEMSGSYAGSVDGTYTGGSLTEDLFTLTASLFYRF